jgi:hypothetical protein
MNAELAILDILLEDEIVRGIVADRVYLNEAPQGDRLPYIIIEESDNEPNDTKDGASAVDYGRVNVFPYHTDQAELRTLAKAIRNAIEGKTPGTYRTVDFDHARFISQSGFNEEIENRKAYAKDQEYEVRVVR